MGVNKIGFDYSTKIVANASGCYIPPLSDEEIAYRKTTRYKVKQWFKYCWLVRKFNSLYFRLRIIWDAIFNVDRFND